MFALCNKLKQIKGINKFNISNNTNITGMFRECFEFDLYRFNNSDEIKNNYKELLSKLNSKTENILDLFERKKEINIHFLSTDQTIQYSIKCFDMDIFDDIKQKLFLKYPELKQKEIFFLSNGNVLDEGYNHDTLYQFGFKKDSVILITDKENINIDRNIFADCPCIIF